MSSRIRNSAGAIAPAALLVFAALTPGCRPRVSAAEPKEGDRGGGPIATVRVATLRQGSIAETLVCYGTAVAAPGESRTLSVPFESRVRRLLVTEGQVVTPGMPLAEVEPSPDARLQFDQARDEQKAAVEAKALVDQRFAMKLTTRQDQQQAEQRVRVAAIRVESLERRGAGGPLTLPAGLPGVVSHVLAQQGQIVPAGAPLLETIADRQIRIRLGVEIGDALRLHPAQSVRLEPVNAPAGRSVGARVSFIAHQVNPQTRLVDVFVESDGGEPLLLNEYFRASTVVGRKSALLVPRAAALPDGDHFVIFTVENGRAVRHLVDIVEDDGHDIAVSGSGLKSGQSVVIEGNAELQDGMAIQLDSAR